MTRPFGYFVHHQGRGHAERCAAIANALPPSRPLTIFCARDDIFPALPPHVEIVRLPSLFEPTGDEAPSLDWVPTPVTLHCAPLGWPGIRRAMATLTAWFDAADPALLICDVSAEIAQLARICSVPHVKVVQHGDRGDAGHQAAYDGAAGLLAPFHADLAQPEWSDAFLAKTCFAGGLGVDVRLPEREVARQRIGVAVEEELILVLSGGGGEGFAQAPLGVGARTRPSARWITIGKVQHDWHATEPANIEYRGWVDDAADYIAAADLVITSTGNTTCQQILAAGRPWLAVPEWRYFDEQHRKAEALAAAGVACVRPHLPSSAQGWSAALDEALAGHRPDAQRAMIDDAPADRVALWLETLATRLGAPLAAPDLPASLEPRPL
ncbi:putative glycosyltransferase [Sphingomonas jinjuensis]|uniref:Putative glycosyltransferase n=1 Tax=Sphingomonas jinjuensis TaxID=535907 RepID=A0A840FF94_9SPHN|nr:glycosyltransferase [Sphingomonas jinjuensis]MBB4154876.1 putative glycosyltransferase [Sphingomonas jinjuensis]